MNLYFRLDPEAVAFGGEGSGNYGHAGRPGERGGSAKGSSGPDDTKFQVGDRARFNGTAADRSVIGAMPVTVVHPHSNADKVTHYTGKRSYEGALAHIPAATVKNDRGRHFEAFHHTLTKLT